MRTFRRSGLGLAMVAAGINSFAMGLPPQNPFDTFGGGGGITSSKPWASFKLDSKKKIQPHLVNASADQVVSYYEKATGITIVRDPALTGTMTVSSAKPVTLSDAFAILSASLSLRGFDLTASDHLLVIAKRATRQNGRNSQRGAGPGSPPGMGNGFPGGFPGGGGPGGGGGETSIVRVYKIKYANASQLAATLNQVLADATSTGFLNNNGMPGTGGPGGGGPGGPGGGPGGPGGGPGGPGGGGPGGGGPGGPPGATEEQGGRAQALAVVQGNGAQGGGFPGGGGFGGGQGGGFGQGNRGNTGGGFGGPGRGGGGNQSATSAYRASADDYSNSIVLNAPERIQEQVKSLIDQLDRPSDTPVSTKVYKLQYASSDDLLTPVQNLLNANAPRGKGGATTQQTQGAAGFLNAVRGQTAGAGQATSDPRTNTIIVSATEDNIKVLDGVIASLDKPVQLQSSVFIFPLNNARSDTVATLLQQAFGQRQGTGTSSGASTTTNRTSTTNTNSTQNNGNRNNGLGGLGSSLPIDLQDPNAQQGQLLTQVGVGSSLSPQLVASLQQGGFGGGGFGGFGGNQTIGSSRTSSSSSTTSTGRDVNGRVVNTSDLTNQVTTISDPNTNSVIVVTSPENAEILRRVIEQLDHIPQQVMIETTIVEATLSASQKLGVEWQTTNAIGKALGNSTGNTTATGNTNFGLSSSTDTVTGLQYTITGSNFNVLLSALQSDSKFQVLSTPRIFTSNNVQAEINISQSVPYITSSQQDVNGNFTYTYAFEPVGIVLTVTPHITKDGYVTMDITQTANDLEGYTSFNAPIVNTREAQTTVSVKDGNTIVLGGIIRKSVTASVNKVPLLGDLPVLGNLFKSTSKTTDRTELLVFLRPRVYTDPKDAKVDKPK